MSSLFQRLLANLTHPEHGWKSTHFWGPVANWGIVGAAVYDSAYKGPETIDIPMTFTMIGYSGLFVRFAWAVQPRNYILFACHSFNVTAQLNQLRRAIEYQIENVENAKARITGWAQQGAVVAMGVAGLVISSGRIKSSIAASALPGSVKNVLNHPAGPMTIFFWAPSTKWALSLNNLADLEKPVEKISLAQQAALTLTGFIWTRYSFVINPVNYNLAVVNATLGLSSGYHLARKIKADYLSN